MLEVKEGYIFNVLIFFFPSLIQPEGSVCLREDCDFQRRNVTSEKKDDLFCLLSIKTNSACTRQ